MNYRSTRNSKNVQKKYRNFDYDYDFYTGYIKMTNCMKIGPLIDLRPIKLKVFYNIGWKIINIITKHSEKKIGPIS